MDNSLKDKTIAGMTWSAVGKVGTLTINFLSNLVLTRLLMPEDFGSIAMLAIFIAVSNVFIQGGLGAALVQKKNPTETDFSTVFFWNLALAVVFYALLFFLAPAISRYYGLPQLKSLLRVQGVVLLIQSLAITQYTQLQKQMNFKVLAIRNMLAAASGTLVGIILAFKGFGAWSLVASAIVAAIVNVILMWKMSPWRPTWTFSFSSLGQLFSFGGLILLSSLVETLYNNLQELIIGKRFSSGSLGYFSQAKKLEEIPATGLSSIVNDVTFPAFSSLQDDREKLISGMRKSSQALAFVNFPMMILLIIVAKPLIVMLYGVKWEPSVPYFQILCLSGLIYTLNTLNTNVVKSLGKGRTFFLLQILKRVIGIAMIIFGVRYGIYGLLYAVAAVAYVNYVISAAANKKIINYGLFKQLGDVFPIFAVSILTGSLTYCIGLILNINIFAMMFIQLIFFVTLYLILSRFLKIESYRLYMDIILKLLKKNK